MDIKKLMADVKQLETDAAAIPDWNDPVAVKTYALKLKSDVDNIKADLGGHAKLALMMDVINAFIPKPVPTPTPPPAN
jgi:hypothetical protein